MVRRGATLAIVLASIVATMMPGTPAGAKQGPPDDEPALFVLRGETTVRKKAVAVESETVEWFTDRPNRLAGEMSARAFVKSWNRFDFDNDPPNAAISSDDVDLIVELENPRLRDGSLVFDATAIRGKLGRGSIGNASIFVDPTSAQQLTLTFKNNSNSASTAMLYQTDPDTSNPQVRSLAWLTKYSPPQTSVVFTWQVDYSHVWGETGTLVPGVVFDASQVLPANLSSTNAVTFTHKTSPSEYFTFQNQTQGPELGSLYISTDNSVPSNTASVGIGMSGAGTFVVQAQPNLNLTFTAQQRYWIAFGDYIQGQVLDISAIANAAELTFGNRTSITATLNADNTWTIS